jgi:two-component system CheB/CheR fusion protein
VTIPDQALQLLALALHELATNALKYGALKSTNGRLYVTWQIVDRTGTPHLELTWAESGVELDEKKADSWRVGQGRELLEQAIPSQLNATTRLEPLKDGIRWELDMPLPTVERRDSEIVSAVVPGGVV